MKTGQGPALPGRYLAVLTLVVSAVFQEMPEKESENRPVLRPQTVFLFPEEKYGKGCHFLSKESRGSGRKRAETDTFDTVL